MQEDHQKGSKAKEKGPKKTKNKKEKKRTPPKNNSFFKGLNKAKEGQGRSRGTQEDAGRPPKGQQSKRKRTQKKQK